MRRLEKENKIPDFHPGDNHPQLADPKLAAKDKTPKKRNDIRELRSTRQLKFVHLDLESPTMREAIEALGLELDDLDTEKTADDFA